MGIELRGLSRGLGRLKRLPGESPEAREALLGDRRLILARIGIGRHAAVKSLQLAVSRFNPERVLLIGLAGGLRHEFRVGDPFVISSAALWPGDAENLSIELAVRLQEKFSDPGKPLVELIKGGRRVRRARLLSVDSFVGSTSEKRKFGAAGYDLVDMEFAAVAAAVQESGTPVTGLKVISDTLSHNFPRYRFSAVEGSRGMIPPRLAANSFRACRVLGCFALVWLEALINLKK